MSVRRFKVMREALVVIFPAMKACWMFKMADNALYWGRTSVRFVTSSHTVIAKSALLNKLSLLTHTKRLHFMAPL